MKICLAQCRSFKGDIAANVAAHQRFVLAAVEHGAELIVFPELSLTGYEPTLAKELAMEVNDGRLDVFQQLAAKHSIAIAVGLPINHGNGVCISLGLFQAAKERALYSKRYLHADEEPFFVPGAGSPVWKVKSTAVSLAVCYELSVPEHSELAFKSGGQVYVASVAKSANGVAKAYEHLSAIASKYSLPVLMCNGVGPADDFVNAGGSVIWDSNGKLLAQLNDSDEGLLMMDTETGEWYSYPLGSR